MAYVLVFIGGGLGSLARFGIGHFTHQWWPSQFPVGTIIVNILSAFILGLLMSWLVTKPAGYDQYRLLIATGFCGGFSTFSMFTLELFNFTKNGLFGMALLNIIISITACLLAFWLGTISFRH